MKLSLIKLLARLVKAIQSNGQRRSQLPKETLSKDMYPQTEDFK